MKNVDVAPATPKSSVGNDAPPPTTPAPPVGKHAPRLLTHIQALRAIAVLLVVLYHLWPNRLTGGYVGVDVFFVISGYLMTSHILRGAATGRSIPAGLNDFYVRRIKRILPASLFVLLVITVITLLAVSRIEWDQYLGQIIASTLYVENWSLAFGSTDYLAAGVGASPVQHFWSLSVEEQFYLIWPVLLLVTCSLVAVRNRQRAVVALVAALVIGSLAYSVLSTASDAKFAYFDTFARLWEFGIGGVLAVVPALNIRNRTLAGLVAYLGLAAIAVSALIYSGTTDFPGYTALLPVLGTAAIIASGQHSRVWGPHQLFAWRPVQFIGDISYSMYLWHWPMIVLVPVLIGSSLSTTSRIAIFAATILVAWLSKKFLEDPFRVGFRKRSTASTSLSSARTDGSARPAGAASAGAAAPGPGTSGRPERQSRGWVPYIAALAAMALIVVIAGAGWLSVRGSISSARQVLADTAQSAPACFGAEMLSGSPGCTESGPALTQVVPDPLVAAEDFPYDVCQQRASRSAVINCEFGATDGSAKSIALIGDSHATQWLPALIAVAQERNWHITTYLMSGCAFAESATAPGGKDKCATWNAEVKADLAAQPFDAVIVSARGASSLAADDGSSASAANLARAWQNVIDQGSTLIALRDVPQPENAGIRNVPACVYDKGAAQCSFAEDRAERFDLIPQAAASVPQAQVIDMSPYFCQSGTCQSVVGSVLVYLDGNHMTATYSASLASALAGEFDRIGFN